jgi:monothiol glutaredoxin
MPMNETLRVQIEGMIASNDVVLFMKGSRHAPQCGFSAAVIEVLDEYLPQYETVNVLSDPGIRDGIKEFSDWPTIPQLYVKGEFVGGADIVREMHANGELSTVLGRAPIDVAAPDVTLSASALSAFKAARDDEDEYKDLRLEVSNRFQYALSFGPALAGDIVIERDGLTIRLDRGSARRVNGMKIDFLDGPNGAGFKIENPNEPPKVQNLSVQELKSRVDGGTLTHVYDVRPDEERAISSLAFATQLTEAKAREVESLDKSTPLAFLCRSGQRSRAAAEHFLSRGFKNVWNITGGINAWSDEIDSSVQRY